MLLRLDGEDVSMVFAWRHWRLVDGKTREAQSSRSSVAIVHALAFENARRCLFNA